MATEVLGRRQRQLYGRPGPPSKKGKGEKRKWWVLIGCEDKSCPPGGNDFCALSPSPRKGPRKERSAAHRHKRHLDKKQTLHSIMASLEAASTMPVANDLQWPSIENLAREIAYPLERFVRHTAPLAAQIIQYHVRQCLLSKLKHAPTPVAVHGRKPMTPTRSQLSSYFLDEGCVASIKLDGTNVAIAEDGALYGRRLRVPDDAESYQKCDLRRLRGRQDQVQKLRTGLGLPSAVRLRLFGELVMNNRFDYSAEGLFKTFCAFGAIADVSALSESDRDAAFERVLAMGMAATTEGGTKNDDQDLAEPKLIVIRVNDEFRGLLSACSSSEATGGSGGGGGERDKSVAQVSCGSLVSIVAETADFMMECKGEGLVLTWKWRNGSQRDDKSTFSTAKYKCACEEQGGTTGVLEKLQGTLEDFEAGPGCGFLLPTGVRESMVPQMLAVSRVAPAADGPSRKQRKGEDKAAAKEQTYLIVEGALESALTKFDSPESFFEIHGGSQGCKMMVDLLVNEMKADLLAGAEGTDGSIEKKQILAAGRGAVNRFVGVAFGKWKVAQQSAPQGGGR